ncbi:MFS transporter [Nocardia sp. BMG111209]|uniref:MFS transporter n=1 Tax=Nocardia sp. BMG111209 TaxID=1160137 RepID=UPI00039C68BA|nr:MFS transporter [Nocardia sp. BMG111209]
MTDSRGRRAAWLAGVRRPGVLRLALVRFAGQFGDGMFQAALGGAILFNPERETDPLAIAGGFTVLLLPYSIIGPYAGALLDRWDRRTVLLVANLLRAVLIGVTAVGLLSGIPNLPLELLALAVIGISRFVLAGVSAALPRVLAPNLLIPMNSVLATVASGCAAAGAALAVALIGALGSGNLASAVATGGSAVGSVLGALAAASFGARVLGPDAEGQQRENISSLRAILTGLRTGARAVWESVECTTAMIGVAAHRIVFGADTLIMVLVLRRDQSAGLSLHSGLGGFGVAIAAAASGMLVAAVVAPLLIPRLGRPRTVAAGLVTAVVVQALLVTPVTMSGGPGDRHAYHLLLAGAFLLGLAGQTIKLTGDATLQLDVEDARRGQVFALQDTIFNVGFVLAVAVAALIVPADGRSVPVALAGAGVYALGVVAVILNGRRAGARPGSEAPGPARPLPR